MGSWPDDLWPGECPMYRKSLAVVVWLGATAAVCVAMASQPPGAAPKSEKDENRERAQAVLEAARRGLAFVGRPGPGTGIPYDGIHLWSRRVLEAKLDLSKTPAERIAARKEYLERMIKLEE